MLAQDSEKNPSYNRSVTEHAKGEATSLSFCSCEEERQDYGQEGYEEGQLCADNHRERGRQRLVRSGNQDREDYSKSEIE